MNHKRWTAIFALSLKWAHDRLCDRDRHHPSFHGPVYNRVDWLYHKWSESLPQDDTGRSEEEILLDARWQLLRTELGAPPPSDLHGMRLPNAIRAVERVTQKPKQREGLYDGVIRGLLGVVVSHDSPMPPDSRTRILLALQVREHALSRRELGQARSNVQKDVFINNLIARALAAYTRSPKFREHPIPLSELRRGASNVADTSPALISPDYFFVATRSSDYDLARAMYRLIRFRRSRFVPSSEEKEEEAAAEGNSDVAEVQEEEDHHPPTFVWKPENESQLRNLFFHFYLRDPRFALAIYSHWTRESGLAWPAMLWKPLFKLASARLDVRLLEHILNDFERAPSGGDYHRHIGRPLPPHLSPLPPSTAMRTTTMLPDLAQVVIETFVRSGRVVPALRALRVLERYSRPYRLRLEHYHPVFALLAVAKYDRSTLLLRLLDSLPREPEVTTYNIVLAAVVSRWNDLDSTSLARIGKLWNDMVAPSSASPWIGPTTGLDGDTTPPSPSPPTRGGRPNGRTYSCLVFGLVRLGELDAAARLWNHALAEGVAPEVKKDVLVLLAYALDAEKRTVEAEEVYRWAWPSEEKREPNTDSLVAEAFRRQRREEEEEEKQQKGEGGKRGERLRVRTFFVGKRLLHDRRGDEPVLARVVELLRELELELLEARGIAAAEMEAGGRMAREGLVEGRQQEEEEETITVGSDVVDRQLQA
jgi:pentatricopeptide repeat protein